MKRGGKLLKKLEESRKVSANLRENEKYLRSRMENCSDILIRPMRLGDKHKVDCLMVYIEVAVSNMMLDIFIRLRRHHRSRFPSGKTS